MAIHIEWQVKPPGKNEEKPQMYPRITESEVIDEPQLAKLIAAHGSLSRGTAQIALNDLAEVMAKLLQEGKAIDLPALGTFKLSISTDAQVFPNSDRRMQHIVVRGVNFQPSPALMDAIGKPSFSWSPTGRVAIAPSASQLAPLLLDYFKTHDNITRADFERLSGLKRTTAYIRLKELEKMGVIQAVGHGQETKYKKNGSRHSADKEDG